MKVFINGGNQNYLSLFEGMEGVEITKNAPEADALVFTGGSDVNPELYGKECLPTTHYDDDRDLVDGRLYYTYPDKIRIGICRGAQFLHVMAGGKLNQHIEGHLGDHEVDAVLGEGITVTSTHHQSMDYDEVKGYLLAWSNWDKTSECIWHEEQKSFCFQPHPEFHGADSTRELFMVLLGHVGVLY